MAPPAVIFLLLLPSSHLRRWVEAQRGVACQDPATPISALHVAVAGVVTWVRVQRVDAPAAEAAGVRGAAGRLRQRGGGEGSLGWSAGWQHRSGGAETNVVLSSVDAPRTLSSHCNSIMV
jgi:hypothetical protein